MVPDNGIVTMLRSAGERRCDDTGTSPFDYRISDVRHIPGAADIAITQRDGATARLRVVLPSSGSPKPWLYADAIDAEDWVGQLLVWIDEEVQTLGLGPSRARAVLGGESYVVVEPYGWRLSNRRRHERLSGEDPSAADGIV